MRRSCVPSLFASSCKNSTSSFNSSLAAVDAARSRRASSNNSVRCCTLRSSPARSSDHSDLAVSFSRRSCPTAACMAATCSSSLPLADVDVAVSWCSSSDNAAVNCATCMSACCLPACSASASAAMACNCARADSSCISSAFTVVTRRLWASSSRLLVSACCAVAAAKSAVAPFSVVRTVSSSSAQRAQTGAVRLHV